MVQWCNTIEPINAVKAIHIAFNQREDEEAYTRQPGMVYIYNPEDHPLTDIITHDNVSGEASIKVIAYDGIETSGMSIWIPYYYSVKDKLINMCPVCAKPARATRIRKPKNDQ